MANFKQTKQKYRQYYKENLLGKAFDCKLINAKIHFTRKGWDHIIRGTKVNRRKGADMIRRLKLLRQVKLIARNADKFQTVRRNNINYYEINYSKTTSKLILKKDSLGKYIFYSIM